MQADEFYNNSDNPSEKAQARMWAAIEQEMNVSTGRRKTTFFLDKRSFIYGIAASLVLMFAGFGAYSAVDKTIASSRPDQVQYDAAYRTAIKALEKVVPTAEKTVIRNSPDADVLANRKEQIALLDTEIYVLQHDAKSGDLSAMKQTKLRQLYRQKLQILQEMIENGEIPL